MSKKQNKIIAKLQREIEEKQAYCDHHLERRRQAEADIKQLDDRIADLVKQVERQKSFAQQMAKRNVNLDRAFKKYRFAVAYGASPQKLQEILDELKSTRPDQQANRPIGPMPSPQELRELFIKGTETGRSSSKRPNFTEVNRPLSPEVVNQYVSDIKKDAEDSFDVLGPQMAAYHGVKPDPDPANPYDAEIQNDRPVRVFKPGKTLEQIAEESGVNKLTESDILNLRNCLQIAYKSAGKEDILPEHIKVLKDLIAYKDDQLDREINSHQETEIAPKKLEGKYAKLERYYATSDLGATSDRELYFTFDTVSLS